MSSLYDREEKYFISIGDGLQQIFFLTHIMHLHNECYANECHLLFISLAFSALTFSYFLSVYNKCLKPMATFMDVLVTEFEFSLIL